MFWNFAMPLTRVRPWLVRRQRQVGHFMLVLPLFWAAAGLAATESGSIPYEAMSSKLRQHPAVNTAEAQARQWMQNANGALGLPNPNLTLGLNNLPVNEPTRFDRYLPSSRSLELMQAIPNAAGREALRDSNLARASLAELERYQILAGLEKRLLTALVERRRIGESEVALDRQLGLLAELERWLRGEMEGGGAVYGRFDELDVQRGRITEQKLALVGEDLRWQAELRELIDQAPEAEPPPIEPRHWDGEPSWLIAVQVANRKLAVARAQTHEKRAAFNPDYAFGVAYQQREAGANFDGDDWFTVKLTVSLPLWAESNQKPKLSASEEEVTRVMAEREQRLREARGEYDIALAEYRTAEALLQALTQRAARLDDLEAANRRRYEAGEGSLEAVIRPAMQRTEIELDQAKQQARRAIAAARINALLMEKES